MKLNKLFIFTLLIFVFTFSSCTENDDTSVNQEINDDTTDDDDGTNEDDTSEDDNDLYTGTRTFTASANGTGNLTVGLCEFPFTSVTESLEITLNYEKDVLISGTYNLDIKTEVGTPVSADDVVCSIDPTFDETHSGDLTILSDGGISFTTSIGTSNDLTGVSYTFNGTASETSYTGTVQHASPALSEIIVYELDSEIIHSTKTFNATGNGTGTLTIASLCAYPFTSVTEGLELTLNFENGTLTSGTYNLDIKTEVGTPVSADDVVCNFDPTFDENHTGNLTILTNGEISFTTSIGTSNNLTGVSYTFNGTATEASYTGTAAHASLSLNETVTYSLNSETVK